MTPIILTLISSLLPIVVTELQNLTGLSPAVGTLIDGLGTAATGLATTLTSSPATAPAVLTALGATMTVLQTELAGNGQATNALIYLGAFDAAVQAGLAASKITAVDPTLLAPVVAA